MVDDINLPVFGTAPDPTDLDTFETRVDEYMAKWPEFSTEANKFIGKFNGGWKLVTTADQAEFDANTPEDGELVILYET